MASTILLSDNGVSSGSAGLKEQGGNDGVLILQTTTSGGTATNAVYVNNAQYVGVNTNTPKSPLNVSGNVTINNGGFTENIYYDGSWKYSSSAAIVGFVLAADSSGAYFSTAPASGTVDGPATVTERLRFGATGNATFTNNISVGGATPTTSGTGITFPATQSASTNANTLDDYEEGTWAPFFAGSAGNPTISYTTQQGTYTKIGNVVTASIRLITNTISGGAGDLLIAGLPFLSNASPGNVLYSAPLSFVYAFSLNPTMGFLAAGDNSIALYSSSATNTKSTVANLGAGVVYFSLSVTYQTA